MQYNSFGKPSNNFNDYYQNTSKLINYNRPIQSNTHNNDTVFSRNKKYHYSNKQPQNNYEYGLFSRRNIGTNNNNNSRNIIHSNNLLNKQSRILTQNNSSISNGYQNQQLFSQQMIFLLSQQQNNIKYFKQRIDKEKQKIQKQFDTMKTKIIHIIDDLKISFQAQLDNTYKSFISKYKQFKIRMQQLKDVRKVILQENLYQGTNTNDYLNQFNTTKNVSISNRDLLAEIEKDAHLFRNHKLITYISQVQKEKLQPAKRVTQQIVTIGKLENQFFKEYQTRQLLTKLILLFEKEVKSIYQDISDNYVISNQKIIKNYYQNKQANNMILNALSQDNNKSYYSAAVDHALNNRQNIKSLDPKDFTKANNISHSIKINPPQKQIINNYGMNISKYENQNNSPKKYQRPVSHSIDYLKNFKNDKKYQITQNRKLSQYQNYRQRPTSDWKSSYQNNSNRNYQLKSNQKSTSGMNQINFQERNRLKIGLQQQNLISDWIQQIKIKQINHIDAYQHQDAMLCCIFTNNFQQIVTGGKDKKIRVYGVQNGKLICTLQGHKSNICSMANHDNFISSGGDIGCGSLILWDTKTWTIHSKVQAHTAAISSIVDLQDKQHLATGSYDKRILIYNYKKSVILFQVKSNSAAISCMSLSSDFQRLISANLDNTLSIWKINRKNNRLINIELEKNIHSNGLVCSLRSFKLKRQLCFIGTKQGKIFIVNILNGQTVKKLAVSGGSIIEMVVFQRQNKNQWPLILSCSPKQKSMILTKTQTGVNTFIDVKGKLNVDFGCGIGPKVILSQNMLMGILSQSNNAKQIIIYKINIQ